MEIFALIVGSLIGMIIGLIIGIIAGVDRMRKVIEEQSVGNLRIDRSLPDEPVIPFLEVKGTSIERIAQKKFVMLRVINESYISHD